MYQTGTYIDKNGCAMKFQADGTFLRYECFNQAGQSGTTTNGELNGAVGYVDTISATAIRGWAYDANDFARSIEVHVYADGQAGRGGTLVGSGLANQPRGDVNSLFGITGDHGFNFAVPASLCDGRAHSIFVYGIDTAGNGRDNLLLGGSGKTLTCTGTPAAAADQQQIRTPGSPAPKTLAITGFLDIATCTDIYGWAADRSNASAAIDIKIYADGPNTSGKLIGTTTRQENRPDVSTALGMTGVFGFHFVVPANILTNGTHTIYAYATAGSLSQHLETSPKTITCTGSTATTDVTPRGDSTTTNNNTTTGTTDNNNTQTTTNTGPSTFVIAVPAAGSVVTGPNVTIMYYSTVDVLPTDYPVFQVDSGTAIEVRQSTGGSYTLSIAPGQHTLKGYLKRADGSVISNTTTSVTFTVQ
jgi:hypothetical protein